MKYELAKALKDAGFPQEDESNNDLIHPPYCTGLEDNNPCKRSDMAYKPTLGELIEECGNGYFKLEQATTEKSDKKSWLANTDTVLGECESTPEEAVARLWLALNKK